MKKNIILFLITTFTIVACQKESEVLPTNDGASYWVENGILNVKNQAVLDSLIAVTSEKSEEEMVAWSDSVGFKSLAAVYKDAEKQFTCAIENVNLVGFANENKCIVINGSLQNLKSSESFSFNPELSLNLKGGIVSNYAASFNPSHTRWFFVRFGGGIYQQPIGLFRSFDDPTFGRWSIVNEVRA